MYDPYKKLLTIGITAFNEAKYLEETIKSCVTQAGCVIVCDNASTDNSEEICRKLAAIYSNLTYIRLDKDLGKDHGFNLVLDYAKTKYFMWCGPHDVLGEAFSSNMIHMLENSEAVGCFPAGKSITITGEEIGIYDYWYSQDLTSDSASKRVYSLIKNLHDLTGFYGIFKTEIAQKYPIIAGIGSDHVFLCNIAKEGKIIFCPRSIFNWRQTKLGLSHAEVVQTWQKQFNSNQSGQDYKIMQMLQLEALQECKTKNPLEWILKINFVRKAKKKLRKRFG